MRYTRVCEFLLRSKVVPGTAAGFSVGKPKCGSLIYTTYSLLPFSFILKFLGTDKPIEPFFGRIL